VRIGAAGIELARAGAPAGARGGAGRRLERPAAHSDTLVLAPPFVSTRAGVDRMVDQLRAAITTPHSPTEAA
jgi:adenosylmethionine-8-amino-7-oxononanoate aminotransferase